MHGKKQVNGSIKRTTFALKQVAIRGNKASLSSCEDAAIGFSGFLEWYFLSSCCKWKIPSIDSQVFSAWVFFFNKWGNITLVAYH